MVIKVKNFYEPLKAHRNNLPIQFLSSSGKRSVYALGQNRVSRVVNHTEHSLFLTSILVGTDFWNTLTPELQTVVGDAAKTAARHERELSIADVELVQERCEADGIEVVRMSVEEQARFADATQVVYEKYQDYFTAGLVDQIKRS